MCVCVRVPVSVYEIYENHPASSYDNIIYDNLPLIFHSADCLLMLLLVCAHAITAALLCLSYTGVFVHDPDREPEEEFEFPFIMYV